MRLPTTMRHITVSILTLFALQVPLAAAVFLIAPAEAAADSPKSKKKKKKRKSKKKKKSKKKTKATPSALASVPTWGWASSGCCLLSVIGVLGFFVLRKKGGGASVPQGELLGTYKIAYYPDDEAVFVEIPSEHLLRFIVYRVRMELDYLEGTPTNALCSALSTAAQRGESRWRVADDKGSLGTQGVSYRGSMWEGSWTVSGVVGVANQPEMRQAGLAALIAAHHKSPLPGGHTLGDAVVALIDQERNAGPARGKESIARAYRAFSGSSAEAG